MRATNQVTSAGQGEIVCGECEQIVASYTAARGAGGASVNVCEECLAAYYIACAACRELFPQDEARTRDNLNLCAECFTKPLVTSGKDEAGNDAPLESLIAEYVALHVEEKRIKGQMEALKERLKQAAENMPRTGSAVTLRAGEEAVRCSYRAKLKCDDAVVEHLTEMLAPEEFARLFERKVSFNPHDKEIAEFLIGEDDERREARDLLRASLRETETVTLTVVPVRKQ